MSTASPSSCSLVPGSATHRRASRSAACGASPSASYDSIRSSRICSWSSRVRKPELTQGVYPAVLAARKSSSSGWAMRSSTRCPFESSTVETVKSSGNGCVEFTNVRFQGRLSVSKSRGAVKAVRSRARRASTERNATAARTASTARLRRRRAAPRGSLDWARRADCTGWCGRGGEFRTARLAAAGCAREGLPACRRSARARRASGMFAMGMCSLHLMGG